MNNLKKPKVLVAALILVLAAGISSCKKDDDNGNVTPPAENKDIRLANDANLGSILTDNKGMTLYSFALDVNGQAACVGDCLLKWPVFYKADPSLGTGLKAGDFAVITRTDGAKQSTYKGWPLYYFASDKAAGEVKGEAVGNTWFVSKPDYSVMLGNAQLIGHDGVSYNSLYVPATAVTQYLTDDRGRTLYMFVKDAAGKNNYTLSDFSNDTVWPIYQQAAVLRVPSILAKTDFGVITVFGKSQLSYKGWPVYYFGADGTTRGSNKGISFPKPGVWPILNTDTKAAL